MPVDLAAAAAFMATHARLLDRRRFDLLLAGGDPDGVLAALDAYRNADGGYGWGLEPDLRSGESQPVAAMHALEVLAEVGPAGSGRAVALCDWLGAHSLADGGMPMALPVTEPAGSAPWWVGADPTTSTLQMTAQLAAKAHVIARRDADVAAHPWLAAATRWCTDAIGRMDAAPNAFELLFAIHLADAVSDTGADADALLDRLAPFVPPDGTVPVEGGAEDERLHPLDLAPLPDRPARRLIATEAIAADLERLAGLQQADGGWIVGFPSSSPAGALEWRGYATVGALHVLRENGVLP